MASGQSYDFAAGEVLLVDKPLGWTSFQVVNKLRYPLRKVYRKKKFKVGHAGTLDPLATGLLVICTGKMTKQIQSFINDDKVYTGVIQLGATTPSFDLETAIDATFSTAHITPQLVEQVREQFTGPILQHPPIFSAKRVQGKRAYDLARAGAEVTLKSVPVVIHELELQLRDEAQIAFRVRCSKGTYIRSLAHDIGKALDSGGHLTVLRRIQSGEFSIESAKSVEEWGNILRAYLPTPTT